MNARWNMMIESWAILTVGREAIWAVREPWLCVLATTVDPWVNISVTWLDHLTTKWEKNNLPFCSWCHYLNNAKNTGSLLHDCCIVKSKRCLICNLFWVKLSDNSTDRLVKKMQMRQKKQWHYLHTKLKTSWKSLFCVCSVSSCCSQSGTLIQ